MEDRKIGLLLIFLSLMFLSACLVALWRLLRVSAFGFPGPPGLFPSLRSLRSLWLEKPSPRISAALRVSAF
jgi:hypothetical protein